MITARFKAVALCAALFAPTCAWAVSDLTLKFGSRGLRQVSNSNAVGMCSSHDQCRTNNARNVYCNPVVSQCNACGWYDEPCCNTELSGFVLAPEETEIRPNNAFVCSPDSRVFGGVVRRVAGSGYKAYTGPWQGCSNKCTEGGWEFRSVMCLDSQQYPVDFGNCKSLISDVNVLNALFMETRPCSRCPSWFGSAAVTQGPYGACTASGKSVTCNKGSTSRSVDCPAGNSHCPAPSRGCNTATCAADLTQLQYSWKVNDWSECQADNSTTVCNKQRVVGQLTRTVECCSGASCGSDLKPCLDKLGGHAPQPTMQCLTNKPCNSTIYTCGRECDLDKNGECCPADKVDACGVCLGTATLVDDFGTCCATGVDANGLCCPSGDIDSSGVCDGVNSENKVLKFDMGKSGSEQDAKDLLKSAVPGVSFESGYLSVKVDGSKVTASGKIYGYSAAAVQNLLSKKSVTADVEWTSECGNGLCEWGERNSTYRCEKDCPVPLRSKACPGSPLPCSGNGICLAQSGVCACFKYAFGDDCSQNAYGFVKDTSGMIRLPTNDTSCAVVIPLDTPEPTKPPTPPPTEPTKTSVAPATTTAASPFTPATGGVVPPGGVQASPAKATPVPDSRLSKYAAYTPPTNPPTVTPTPDPAEKKGLAAGYIVLIVLGVGLVAAAMGWFAYMQTRPGDDDK